jgi:hypothetical protein
MQPRLSSSRVAPDAYAAVRALNDYVDRSGREAGLLDLGPARATRDPREVIADVHARYFGAELNDQSLCPAGSNPRLGATCFEDWLSRTLPQPG